MEGNPLKGIVIFISLFIIFTSGAIAKESRSYLRKNQNSVEKHYWIILMDVSLSFDKRDREQSKKLGIAGYSLRNELLTLSQMSLAVLEKLEEGRQRHYHAIYIFGKGVRQVSEFFGSEVLWEQIKDERWWKKNIPENILKDMQGRTEITQALQKAVERFKTLSSDMHMHLLLISDGELDVGEENRLVGRAPHEEELAEYKNLLSFGTTFPLMDWLAEHGVSLYTLTIDDNAGRDRQTQLRSMLHRFPGETPLERCQNFIISIAQQTPYPESEGPYVMQALADSIRGQSWTVSYDNVLNIFIQMMFPEGGNLRFVVPGSNMVFIFSPIDAKIMVDLEDKGEIFLIYDEERPENYKIEPPITDHDFQVQVKRTFQYALWLVYSPNMLKVGSPNEENTVVYFPTNVKLVWDPNQPPSKVAFGQQVRIALDLVYFLSKHGKDIEWWRGYMKDNLSSMSTEVTVSKPDKSSPIPIPMCETVPEAPEKVVLKLRGVYPQADAEGVHTVNALVKFGSYPQIWGKKPQKDTSFFVVRRKPPSSHQLPPPRLYIRTKQNGILGPAIPVLPVAPGVEPAKIIVNKDKKSKKMLFEFQSNFSKEPPEIPDGLYVSVPEANIRFDKENNKLPEPIADANKTIIWRSPDAEIPQKMKNKVVTIKSYDGKEEHTGRVRFLEKFSLLYIIISLLLLFIAIISLTISIIVNRKKLKDFFNELKILYLLKLPFSHIIRPFFSLFSKTRDKWNDWQGHNAFFNFNIYNNEWKIWSKEMGPKRLLLTENKGDLIITATHRRPKKNESAVEFRPVSKNEYKFHAISGDDWSYRFANKKDDGDDEDVSRPMDFQTLGKSGRKIRHLKFVRGVRLEIKNNTNKRNIIIAIRRPSNV